MGSVCVDGASKMMSQSHAGISKANARGCGIRETWSTLGVSPVRASIARLPTFLGEKQLNSPWGHAGYLHCFPHVCFSIIFSCGLFGQFIINVEFRYCNIQELL